MFNNAKAVGGTEVGVAGGVSGEVEGAESPVERQKSELQQLWDIDKREFDKRYTLLMVMLINAPDSNGLTS